MGVRLHTHKRSEILDLTSGEGLLDTDNATITGLWDFTHATGLKVGGTAFTSADIGNWNTAHTDTLKWDGGSTGLNASTGRTSLVLVLGIDVQVYNAAYTKTNVLATITTLWNFKTGTGEIIRIMSTTANGDPSIGFYQDSTSRSYIQHTDSGNMFRLASKYGGIDFYTGSAGTPSLRASISDSGDFDIVGALSVDSLTLSTALAVTQGGTGATTAAAALNNLGADAKYGALAEAESVTNLWTWTGGAGKGVKLNDNTELKFGSGTDWQFVTAGTHLYLDQEVADTNDFYIRQRVGDVNAFQFDISAGDFHTKGDMIAFSTTI